MVTSSAPVVTSPIPKPSNDGDGNLPYPMLTTKMPYPMPSQQSHLTVSTNDSSDAKPDPSEKPYAISNYPAPIVPVTTLSSGDHSPYHIGKSVCPPGLEYLKQTDQLIDHHRLECLKGYSPPITAPPRYGAQPAYPMPPPTQVAGPMSNWMPVPLVIPNCPPGLENLTRIDQLLVHQEFELIEDTDCCTRNCCGPCRPFDMKILDNARNEVIHLNRPLRCDSCWCPCCLQVLEVMAPPGQVIGYVIQEWTVFCPKFRIENAAGDCVFYIDGPFCTWSICGDVKFQVVSSDRTVQVGKIAKQWSGLLIEGLTDMDHFRITFPMDLDVKMKAVLLGACLLIDYMFFEKAGHTERDAPGMF